MKKQKENQNQERKSSRGITLIALVITIIVLLILAGISITMLAGDNSILQKAGEAKEKTEEAQATEQARIDEYADVIDETMGVVAKLSDKKTKEGEDVKALSETKITTLQDDFGNIVKVPKGFGIPSDSGTNIVDGIVIEDVTHADTKGSQFVWVPVGTGIKKSATETVDITLGRYTFDDEGNETLVQAASKTEYATGVAIYSCVYEYATNPDGTTYENTKAKDLGAFIKSAIDNGGYYIARYEAGINADSDQYKYAGCTGYPDWLVYGDSNKKFAKDGTVKPLSIKGKGVWNAVTQPEAAAISRNMYSDLNSDLINSYAWDTAIMYIEKCGTNSNYANKNDGNGTLKVTGNNSDEQCKISDMAGNVFEWTTETACFMDKYCVYRGGFYGDDGANRDPAIRLYTIANYAYYHIGFRPLLYL